MENRPSQHVSAMMGIFSSATITIFELINMTMFVIFKKMENQCLPVDNRTPDAAGGFQSDKEPGKTSDSFGLSVNYEQPTRQGTPSRKNGEIHPPAARSSATRGTELRASNHETSPQCDAI
jgi:hypothetical protein